MKNPEQTSFDFSAKVEPIVEAPSPSAQVLSLDEARNKKEAKSHAAVYEAILNSIRHLGALTSRGSQRSDN
jgi:anti-sigma regulatory factor (Ser/Thr protein kinase)